MKTQSSMAEGTEDIPGVGTGGTPGEAMVDILVEDITPLGAVPTLAGGDVADVGGMEAAAAALIPLKSLTPVSNLNHDAERSVRL